MIFGEETGECGTPHLQGYLETSEKKSLKQMKSLNNRISFRISTGSGLQNKNYCTKDGQNCFEHGTMMKQGKRSDLEDVVAAITAGQTLTELYMNFPIQMIKHHKGITAVHQKLCPQTAAITIHPIESFSWTADIIPVKTTTILWGAPGIGKTSFVLAVYPKALIVSHLDDLGRFDSKEHTAILFDDVSISHLPRTAQIHLVDQDLPRSIHIRYTLATIPPYTTKIFTTNEDGGRCMLIEDGAIRRRIQIKHLTYARLPA